MFIKEASLSYHPLKL